MFEWFSIAGIKKEVTERIRWSKTSEMIKFFSQVMVFVIAFGLFFIAADFLVIMLLRTLGIGGM